MSKLTFQESKELVYFDGLTLSITLSKINELISKYGQDAYFLEDTEPDSDEINGTQFFVTVDELESDEEYQYRIKYNSILRSDELEELKRLKEKYPFDI
jgi:hypothetical protein